MGFHSNSNKALNPLSYQRNTVNMYLEIFSEM